MWSNLSRWRREVSFAIKSNYWMVKLYKCIKLIADPDFPWWHNLVYGVYWWQSTILQWVYKLSFSADLLPLIINKWVIYLHGLTVIYFLICQQGKGSRWQMTSPAATTCIKVLDQLFKSASSCLCVHSRCDGMFFFFFLHLKVLQQTTSICSPLCCSLKSKSLNIRQDARISRQKGEQSGEEGETQTRNVLDHS